MSEKFGSLHVPLAQISIGKTNPRKHFDEDAISELAASIKEKGVIQPVLLRPLGVGFELVCGERRYRASQIAGKEDIPAYVRELTDEEALELQITENLQRKDVHPMEEAYAIKQLLDRFNEEETAARLGKKVYYIRQRARLNDLSENWQKVFYNGALQVSDALKIAGFHKNVQNELYKDLGRNSRIQLDGWKLKQYQGDLNTAPFDLADASLSKKAGACTACPFNSAHASLFPESAKNPICSNIVCFKEKCDLNFDKQVVIALEDPSIVLVSKNYTVNKELLDRFAKDGHTVIDYNGYSIVNDPEDAPDWEDFRYNYEDSYESEEELREAFEEEVKEFEEEKAATEKKIASGKYLKAFVVEGNNKGAYVYIEMSRHHSTSTKQSKAMVESGNATAADIDNEIARITAKEKRAKELDSEKVHKLITASLGELINEVPNEFTSVDRVLMRLIIQESIGYDIQNEIKKVTGLSANYNRLNPVDNYKALEDLSDLQLTYIVRKIAMQKFASGLPDSHGGYALRKLAIELGTIPIGTMEAEQREKSAKRIERVEARIKELREQKEALAAKAQPAKGKSKTTAAKKAAAKTK